MNHKINFILILSSILLFNACSSSKKVSKVKSIPMWYMNPTKNNTNFIYGSSESFNLKEAKLLALADMSDKLIVQVDSSFTSTTTSNGNLYSKELKKDIKQSSKKINFNNYELENVKNINDTYYVLVKVNRIKLFNTTKKDLDLLHNNINQTYINSNKLEKLEQINKLQSTRNDSKKAKELIYILRALDNNFKYFSYLDLYLDIQNKVQKIKDNLVLNVTSNLSKSLFKNKIINLLNKNDYKVQNSSDLNIALDSNVNYSKVYGWFVAKVTTNINVKSKNKIISNTIISSVGRSSSSRQNALVSASTKFDEELNKIGLDKLLFN